MTTGLVIGKFFPPHKGHEYLFRAARLRVDTLYIVVCDGDESISAVQRAVWIKRMQPFADVSIIKTRYPDDDSAGWAAGVVKHLGFVPDYVFTSENYGKGFADCMGSKHILVDKQRTHYPISGTMVRNNPFKHKLFLQPYVYAYFVKRVVLVGAESTGKTTLARELAIHLNTSWVPEFGRQYAANNKIAADKWVSADFATIARHQNWMEDDAAENVEQLLICDTNSFVTEIWHERYMGKRSDEVEALSAGRRVDLYILCGDEIPFVEDGQRDGEDYYRDWMQKRFIEELTARKLPWLAVTGTAEQRLKDAIKMCENTL